MPQLPAITVVMADLGRHIGAGQHEPVVVCMCVDEARGRDAAFEVELHLAACARQIADTGDAVAADADVTLVTRRARAIHDTRIADQQIKICFHGISKMSFGGALALTTRRRARQSARGPQLCRRARTPVRRRD